jgi:murein L,D-transpeptidase YcbB/YkuD
MRNVLVRRIGSAVVLAVLLVAGGCRKHRKTTSAPNTDAYADKLHGLVAKKALPPEKVDTAKVPNLRWPDFSDYQAIVTQFYDDRNFEVAWTRDGAPTAVATGFIQAFVSADAKGLIPEDYDAPRWAERVAALKDGSPDDAISLFDVAMTVNVMRYISDLRIGRVNPTHFNFGINVADKKYDLAEFVSDNAVDATDVPKLIVGVEPNSEQYRNTEQALGRYIELAKQQAGSGAEPLPTVAKALSVGQEYPAVDALLARLQVEGDLPANAVQPKDHLYDAELSTGVKSFQHRHGIADDGKLTVQTIASMNVPLTARVTQLQNSLERWRWLPDPYLNAPLIVNLPEFVLHGYTPDHKPDFTMKVVVGKVIGEHETPVFAQMMKYLVFRPYWNVPVDIARKELAPHVAANQGYLASKNFEVTDSKGTLLTSYTAQQVAQGGVMVREKPGAKNSLGLVKFMFPNEYSIYLHSTPATQLFDQSRRDFSHGCVRVQKPDELAAWVLQGQGGDWDLAKVQAAMKSGADNRTVSLKNPIPIVIFYVTGLVEDDGHVHFFDDIYGYDAAMQKVLAKGPAYPVKPVPVKVKGGDTA